MDIEYGQDLGINNIVIEKVLKTEKEDGSGRLKKANVVDGQTLLDFFDQKTYKKQSHILADCVPRLNQVIRVPIIDPDVFLTISPNPADMYGKTAKQQYQLFAPMLAKKLATCAIADIYCEWTLAGFIHFHILMKITNKSQHVKSMKFFRSCGNLNIQYVKNQKACYDYCMKDLNVAKELLGIEIPIKIN